MKDALRVLSVLAAFAVVPALVFGHPTATVVGLIAWWGWKNRHNEP